MQNLDIVVWFFSSWQQIMLILVFPVKSPSQNDVFEATDHKYHLCNLRTWFSYVPSNAINKKHIKINEKILRETWCLWGTKTMVGGAYPDTPLVGVQNTTPVGSAHNTTPVGEAHKPPVSKAKGPRDAPSYIPNQSPTPRRKLELRRKGPTFVPVISPLTKAAPLRNHRKGQAAKQTKS